jgi:hypothetical protein
MVPDILFQTYCNKKISSNNYLLNPTAGTLKLVLAGLVKQQYVLDG